MRIPEHIIQEVLRRTRIEDVVSEYVSLTPKGGRLWGLSPFKTEKTPSFTVSPDKGVYYCFSTQKGGNVVSFLMEKDSLSFPEAVSVLAKRLGIDISSQDEEVSEDFRRRSALEELYKRLAQTFQHMLHKTPAGAPALEYLTQKRGLPLSVVEEFRLGFVPADPFWLHRFLIEKKYAPDFLTQSGLFGGKSKDWCLFSGRVVFPITNLSGDVVAFGGRLLSGDGPKYINSPETPIYRKGSTLYAIDRARDGIRKSGCAILCEGYMDALALHAAGVTNAVAPLGTAFTPDQALLLKRFAPELALLFDRDEAGMKATVRALGIATRCQLTLSVITVPDGMKDPADILLERGSQALQKIVDCKIDAYNYLLKSVEGQGVAVSTLGGREKAIQTFLPLWEAYGSDAGLIDALDRFSDLFNLDRLAFRNDIFRRLKRESPAVDPRVSAANNAPRTVAAKPDAGELEVRVLLAAFVNAELFAIVREAIQLEDLGHPWALELFVALEEAHRSGERDVHQRLQLIGVPELRQLVLQKTVDGEFSTNPEAFVKDGLRRIKERNFTRRRDQVDYQLRRLALDPQYDPAVERELLEEKILLNAALKELRNQIDD